MLISVVAGCSSDSNADAEGEVTWKLNHIRPPDTRTDDDAKKFADDVADQTEGRVNIDTYDSAQLGDYQDVQESVSQGEIDMQLASLGTESDPTLQFAVVPSLAADWEEANQLYNSQDGLVTEYLSEQLEEQDIKLLAVYPQYFGSIFLSDEVNEPKDPTSDKKVKARVPGMKSFEEYGKGVGFSVTPLPATEVFTSLQTGVIDGSIGGGTELYYNEYKDLGKYIMPVKTHFESHYLTVNKSEFDNLSEEDQNSIMDIAEDFEEDAFEQAEKEDTKYDELMEEEGVEVIDFTDEELDEYADHVRKEVWPEIQDEYGDVFEDVKEEIEFEE